MLSLRNFVLLSVFIAAATASPGSLSRRHSTHRFRRTGSGTTAVVYSPPGSYEVFGEGITHPLSQVGGASTQDIAIQFVASRLGLKTEDLAYHSGFDGQMSKHAYLKQQLNGIPVANAIANVAVNNNGKIISFGSNFVSPKSVSSSTPAISSSDAISKAEAALSAKYNEFPTALAYYAKDDGSAVLAHVVQVRSDKHWYEAFIDAASGDLVAANDFVAEASYRVVPFQFQDPDSNGVQLVADPESTSASPNGWVASGATSGNNVLSYLGDNRSNSPTTTAGDTFDYTFDPSADPKSGTNPQLAAVNAFYVTNTVHDTAYLYGFTEGAFNFQDDNFGNGGAGSDSVQISVQNGADTDNAFFATPPDGQHGEMTMFLWDETDPGKDGALENDIVTHEMGHGITNRLTGGGTGRCLQTLEAAGLGEGWSDALADWSEQGEDPIADFTVGSYVTGKAQGIRRYPYSVRKDINPLTYSSLQRINEEHDVGEVWANVLHNVLAALVQEYGISSDATTNVDGPEGNIVFMHLFIDQLSIQPCNPTFINARDAWIQADATRYGGANKCLLWNAFASKGLGTKAANHNNDSTLPDDCPPSGGSTSG